MTNPKFYYGNIIILFVFSHPYHDFRYLSTARSSLVWPVQFSLGCRCRFHSFPFNALDWSGVTSVDLCAVSVVGVGYNTGLCFILVSCLAWKGRCDRYLVVGFVGLVLWSLANSPKPKTCTLNNI